MMILKAWMHKLSAGIGVVVIAIVMLWPALLLGSINIWLQTLFSKFPINILYPLFAAIAGTYTAMYVYDRKVLKCCRVKTGKVAASSSFFGILLGACPACIPAVGFFLPLSATIAISYYSWIFLSASIIILLLFIWKGGGFKKAS